MARMSRLLRAVAVVLAYGVLGALVLGGGVGLRAAVVRLAADDRASAASPPATAAGPATTETTWLLETTTTTILFRAAPTTSTSTTAPPPPAATRVAVAAIPPDRAAVWFQLADCESGVWGAGKVPRAGSANWAVVDEVHQGGLQIRAGQWDQHRVRFPGFPEDAHLATPEQQIAVAEVILAGQGVRAWPTCGPRIGLERLV